ncbi:MAG: glycosyltransferase [Actinobacteria bacterium]|nr:glycosyltransferase [Actinomycetota bacterium]
MEFRKSGDFTIPPSQKQTRRFRTRGRSLLLGEEKFHARGVTYGTFRPVEGVAFPSRARVEEDFAAMAAAGVNSLRTYERPPEWLLDAALERGLHVMVGVAWEQHLAFLEDPWRSREIAQRLAEEVRRCEAHPAILCYSVGNEIPAAIVRWHGKRAVERFIERLYLAAKEADPDGLVTYVNYPSTEYLELPFLDLAAFNVYLEDESTYAAYLSRLHNLSGDRPLLLTEVGIDSRRGGVDAQARVLDWQLRRGFAAGAAGTFVFAWTDEWHRGGHDVLDWDFGVVDREREPKPALEAVSRAYATAPFADEDGWPAVSVVVCTYNGAGTLDECLAGAGALNYPDVELIVVVDGGDHACVEIARAHGATAIETAHRGLGHARNVGIEAARGEIVAFLDDDAFPDRDWLLFVADLIRRGGYGGVGGPNVPPDDDGFVAECVAAAPGGPIHILLSDVEAEHVPGCNMAFRRDVLIEIGGFDERFRTAGDDVDLCWRLQKGGHRLGFSAGAVVMHRRRDSVRRYLRQQYGYGKAEALLERKWPGRYNRAGASRWSGRIYEAPGQPTGRRRSAVLYGTWGSGLFQSVYDAPTALPGILGAPEGLLMVGALAIVSLFGFVWPPLFLAAPPVLLVAGWIGAEAVANGWRAHRATPGRSWLYTLRLRDLTALLFLLQPAARLAGRLRNGLSPWRRRARSRPGLPRPRTVAVWSERWASPQSWIEALEESLTAAGGLVRSGGPFDRWDLDLRAGALGGVRLRTVVEEHGHGKQLLRMRVWPRATFAASAAAAVLAVFAGLAVYQQQFGPAIAIGLLIVLAVALALEGTATATRLAVGAMGDLGERLGDAEAQRRARLRRALPGARRRDGAEPSRRPAPPIAGRHLEREERR